MKLLLVASILLFVFASPVLSTINIPDDFPTIQQGIAAAAAFDTVLVRVGTYTGVENCNLQFTSENVYLVAEDGPVVTILDGKADVGEACNAFYFSTEGPVLAFISGFTITNFGNMSQGGAVQCYGVQPEFTNCKFIDNFSSSVGGAVICRENAAPRFIDCEFSGNYTTDWASYAGAVGAWTSSPYVEGCTFTKNSAVEGYGGAIFFAHGGDPSIIDCHFEDNEATHGGALGQYAVSGTISGSTFLRNTASQLGGAVFWQDNCSPVISGCTFFDNSGGSGGVFYIQERFDFQTSEAKFNNVLVAFNRSDDAFDIRGAFAMPTFNCCDMYGNVTDWDGYLSSFLGINGNIESDPLFCDTAVGNLGLDGVSPCLPANNSCGQVIGSIGEGCSPDLAVITPTPMYALYQYAIEPMSGNCVVSMVGERHGANEINPASLRLNGNVSVTNFEILPAGGPFDVFACDFDITEFFQTYTLFWDTIRVGYSITGEYNDSTPLEYGGTITVIGHASGDINSDGNINVGDVVFLINYIFRSGQAPEDMRMAEINCDGSVNVGDAVYMITFIFNGGPPPKLCK